MSKELESPLVETVTPEPDELEVSNDGGDGYTIYTYLLALVVVCLVIFLFYHAYSCFCDNQNSEPYINPQPRTDPQADNAFDVDKEVKKLIQLQETYLEKLQRSRLGN